MTPEAIHYGWAEEIYTARQDTLLSAYDLHPERFVRKTPEPPKLPKEVWINPPLPIETEKVNRSEKLITTPNDTGKASELCSNNEDAKKTKETVHQMQNETVSLLLTRSGAYEVSVEHLPGYIC